MSNIVYEQVDDLQKIKYKYGEKMSHMCRELFPTILESKGLLYYIISSHFAHTKSLYDDIVNEKKEYIFKEYIYYFYDQIRDDEEEKKEYKGVEELLKEKGYTLYECKTNEDIHRFIKYYANGERLCTFKDPHRIDNHYIFFIVKQGAEELDRKKFDDPKREDEYSVSVLDIQFDKGINQRVSIKSRYNHSVKNPDATYSNNLEYIAEGLTEAFEKDYGYNIGNDNMVNFELNQYVLVDDKFYKYNYRIYNVYYCENNLIIDRRELVEDYKDKSRYIFMDYFILDTHEKKIIIYDKTLEDSFVDGINNITKIEVVNQGEYKNVEITQNGDEKIFITLNRIGDIIKYKNSNLKQCGYDFLCYSESLQEIDLPNLETCGDGFLWWNESLQQANLPKLTSCGIYFMDCNKSLKELSLPNLESCGNYFLPHNYLMRRIYLPKLVSCGNDFLVRNVSLQEIDLPSLETCGNDFLCYNNSLLEVNLPKLKKCCPGFLWWNESLREVNLPEKTFVNNRINFSNYMRNLITKKIKESENGGIKK